VLLHCKCHDSDFTPRSSATNSQLKSLVIVNTAANVAVTLNATVSSTTYAYSLLIDAKTPLSFAVSPGDSGAVVTVDGTRVYPGIASDPSILAGGYVVPIVITSTSGTSTSYFVQVINPPSTDALLASLTIDEMAFTNSFDPLTFIYEGFTTSSVTSITIRATVRGTGAAIKVPGQVFGSRLVLHANLTYGGTTQLTIPVWAQDGTTTKNYAVKINQQLCK
jgi:hypothetical protein